MSGSKSPVYIGAGSSELAVTSAQNIIDNANDISLKLQTVEEWASLTDGTTVFDFVDNTQTSEYSAKEYAQGVAATGGTAKQWALGGGSHVEATAVITGKYSARKYATDAATSYDNFDDRFLGPHTTAEREVGSENIGKDHDGDALVAGALYFDTTLGVMKVWTGSLWKQLTPTTANQTQIDTLTTGYDGTTTTSGTNLNIVQVDVVADNVADVNTVAGKATEIGRLGTADAVADMVLLGTTDCVADMALLGTTDCVADMALLAHADVIADMNTLATTDIVSDLNTLATADIVSDLNTLATSDIVNDINTLATADIVSDLNTLATSDIVTDINLLATSDIVSDLNTLATSDIVSDLSTVSDNLSTIQDFANKYRIAGSAPASNNDDGDLYYNTATDQLNIYDGSSWGSIGLTQVQTQTEANNAAVAMSIALG